MTFSRVPFSRVLVSSAVALLTCATGALAQESAVAPRVAAVKTDAHSATGQRLAAPVLLSVEVIPDPAPPRAAAVACDDHDASRCDPARVQAPVAGTRQ
jgi:hypothetical protein